MLAVPITIQRDTDGDGIADKTDDDDDGDGILDKDDSDQKKHNKLVITAEKGPFSTKQGVTINSDIKVVRTNKPVTLVQMIPMA